MILFLSNADTDLLALRVAVEDLPAELPPVLAANPARLVGAPDLEGVELVLVRLLGGRSAWPEPFDDLVRAAAAAGVPLVALGGEAAGDPALEAASTVSGAVVREAAAYLAAGGPANLGGLVRFLAQVVLGCSVEVPPPVPVPLAGRYREPAPGEGPLVGVVFYRAQLLGGNTGFVDDLCRAIEQAGGRPAAVFCYSLRPDADGRVPAVEELAALGAEVVVTTTLAAGQAGAEGEGWDPGALGTLGVPVVQAVCATQPRAQWEASSVGLGPLDVAMQVALPELDGRIGGPVISFKEVVDPEDPLLGAPLTAYRTLSDRVRRAAELAVRLGQLRRLSPAERRVALVLSAYPTRRSRLGNAVGLDTPASAVRLLRALADAGYGVRAVPEDPNALMAELADGLVYEDPVPSARLVARAVGSLDEQTYAAWFRTVPEELQAAVVAQWGPPPGEVHLVGEPGHRRFVFSGVDLGQVLVCVQPPRGFGEDPVAVYHSPDLPPTHHYLAFYRWLEQGFGAHAVVHLGKHGTLEWLPGKGVGLSAACAPDAALGSLPLVYPFVVNDPGEGTQAKRRAHAVIVDHLVPPLTRAGATEDLAALESLLDEHAQVAVMDPAKLPAIRAKVWECLVAAEIHRDLGLRAEGGVGGPPGFDDPAFDDLLLHVDGYLCELKDAQIRGGLHVLGQPPTGPAERDMVAAITRLPQGPHPSLRACLAGLLGLDPEDRRRVVVDRLEDAAQAVLGLCQDRGWQVPEDPELVARLGLRAGSARDLGALRALLGWVCRRLVPALRATAGEIDAVLDGLAGRFVPPGPSGAPSRGQASVLPTGRNFYGCDPRAVPSALAAEVGRRLAEDLLARHLAEEGRYPRHVGLVVWGTAALRTGGDDLAEALWLLGVRPVWEDASGRVVGVEVVPLEELGRPRVDVTLRISGFFRDAFPHALGLLDQAVAEVAARDEPEELNPLRNRGAEPRVFGPKPGSYGSGVLALIEAGSWKDQSDLGAIWLAWSAWSYRPGAMGESAPEALRRRLAEVEVAVKNQDNREHDIFDSDDYLQDHGGMVAAASSLRPGGVKAWFGDSSDPARPRVRSLAEEAARVVRTRVLNPKWIQAMQRHGYKGAFEMAATVDYLFGYDATAGIVDDWMYERVTAAYVADPEVRAFLGRVNPWALRAIAERLLEAERRGLWNASDQALGVLRQAVLEAEGLEERR
jgi:cobaltochelatase CobN